MTKLKLSTTATEGTEIEVAVIGGGPAGLMAAEGLAQKGKQVVLFDRMPSVGRKILVAGKSGLNVSNALEAKDFISCYRHSSPSFIRALESFDTETLREWLEREHAVKTFVGTSGRVFPQEMKAGRFLRNWIKALKGKNVDFRMNHRWEGWSKNGGLVFECAGKMTTVPAAQTILALGGASWPETGSDGSWVKWFQSEGIQVLPLEPSNVGVEIQWPPGVVSCGRQALKNVALSFESQTHRGDLLVTDYGLEGTPVYHLSAAIGESLKSGGGSKMILDLKPDREVADLLLMGTTTSKDSVSNLLRKKFRLSEIAIELLKMSVPYEKRNELGCYIKALKSIPLKVDNVRPIAEAISSRGGVAWDEVDHNFQLHRKPGVYVIGEMLGWDAPTGGFLIHGCLAMGRAAGKL